MSAEPDGSPSDAAVAQDVNERLRRVLEEARRGGSERSRRKQVEGGKLLVRDRLERLLDEPLEFEDGLLARYEEGLPGDAVVTGVGRVDGRTVCVIANDFTVKAGTWGKRTFEKITRTQELADEIGAPIVYLVDAAGARIDEQFGAYAGRHAWGNIFYNQVRFSGRVPQVCALFGPSPAGSAYVPALCDFTVMVRGAATAYLGGPRLAEMVTGEQVTLEEMGGAEMHCRVSGLGDLLADDEDEAIAALRIYLSYLPSSWQGRTPRQESRPPAEGLEVADIVPEDQSRTYDVHDLIDAVVDEDTFFPYKPLFAEELVCGFARLGGDSVGIVANQPMVRGGALFSDSSDKAARFVWLCNAFNVPLLFLVDIAGYMIGSAVERDGIIRHGAKMLFAVAGSRTPRIAVLVRKAYGGGYLAMSGSPVKPDAVIALPTAKPALMGPEAAINAVHYNRLKTIEDERERAETMKRLRAEYEADIDALKIANENAIEAVVAGSDLRDELIARFETYRRRPALPIERRNGVYPV